MIGQGQSTQVGSGKRAEQSGLAQGAESRLRQSELDMLGLNAMLRGWARLYQARLFRVGSFTTLSECLVPGRMKAMWS